MIRIGRGAAPALGVALSVAMSMPGRVVAQTAAAAAAPAAVECSVDETKPSAVATAYFQLSQASSGKTPDAKLKSYKAAIASAHKEIERGENMPGRQWITAKSLMYMMGDSLVPSMTTRGNAGLPGAPTAPIDLIVAVDSLFDAIVATNPDCQEEITAWRQQKPWFELLNGAVTLMQAGKNDSAEVYAKRSLVMYDRAPYAYQVLASIAFQKKDEPGQIENWKKAIETSVGDTSAGELRRQALYYLGNIYAQQSELATAPAEKVRLAREAASLYRTYMTEWPTDTDIPAIRTNLSIVLTMAGDSLEVPALYKDMIDNPSKYTAADLFSSGTIAGRLNRSADAMRLFDAVVKLQPNNRDALFNLAASYLGEKEYLKMIPVGKALIALDPGHRDNYNFLAFAYHNLHSAEPANSARKKQLIDSITTFSNLYNDAQYDVRVGTFSPRDSSTTVSGTIENRDEKAAATYKIKFDFLDTSGAVVTSGEKSVTIPAKATERFEVVVPKGGIAAWRYTITKG